jgi:hypothetical protein
LSGVIGSKALAFKERRSFIGIQDGSPCHWNET